MKLRAILFFLYLSISSYAQEQEKSKFNWSAYIDIYYQYDFNKPSNNNRPSFVYSHNRHNEFNLNLGYLKAGYADSNVRANLALAAGTYMNANYASEPDLYAIYLRRMPAFALAGKTTYGSMPVFSVLISDSKPLSAKIAGR